MLAGFDDPRLRTVRHPEPLGIAASRNALLADARGEFIAWLDSDDRYTNGLSRPSRPASGRQPRRRARPRCVRSHRRPRPAAAQVGPPSTRRTRLQPGEVAFRELLQSNTITTSTVVARRSAHDAAGPVLRSRRPHELRLGDVAPDRPTGRCRLHGRHRGQLPPARGFDQPVGARGRRATPRRHLAVTRSVLQHERRRIPNLARGRAAGARLSRGEGDQPGR